MTSKGKIPEGWIDLTIGDVTVNVEKTDPRKRPSEQFQYLDISGIDNTLNQIVAVKQYRGKEAPSRARQIVREGDTLFSTVRTYLKNIAKVPAKYDREIASTGFSVLRASEILDPAFLFHYTLSQEFLRSLSKLQRGSSYPAVRDSDVREQLIPIPPPNEQKRIVEKIEELFSELDAGVASLQTALAQLGTYRQALLQHAFTGKLTADWRTAQGDQLPDSADLLNKIAQERHARYDQQIADWKAAVKEWEASGKVGKKPSKPRKPKDLSSLPKEVSDNLHALPNGWSWDRLGWMTCKVEYGTSAKSAKTGSHPVLRMGNIQNGKFDWDDLVFTSKADEIEKYLLSDGDVLFNRTNSPELVGKTAIYRKNRPAIFAGYLIRVNHIETVIDGDYLSFFLNSPAARQYGNRVKTDGVNQSNINGTKLMDYPFPYCSLDEQKQIVATLDQHLSVIDKTEDEITENLQKAEILRQAILKKAFAGQLVPQDPNDEPASVLLARIRAS